MIRKAFPAAALAAALTLGLAACNAAGDEPGDSRTNVTVRVTVDFDAQTTRSIPESLEVAETNGAGRRATWEVVEALDAPSGRHALGITSNLNTGHTYNLALFPGVRLTDVDASVAVKAVAGREDQGGGLVWRARDANNYYICRWNPLEDNFRLYVVEGGKRRQIASADVAIDKRAWHTVRAQMVGTRITCFLDGRAWLEMEDATFAGPGTLGLWTKADARTLFDDVILATP